MQCDLDLLEILLKNVVFIHVDMLDQCSFGTGPGPLDSMQHNTHVVLHAAHAEKKQRGRTQRVR
jgi:hypothetical protein